ncbi:uncharacterized protein LOC123923160 [Trifolium pratense]|uniref:uncharacterized protein LOC123923160 n=1 Tax=Trifolium pratense TaxID=57577 RepID=UPI001E695D03|nr:uncharacterized protein LOC123923160 [Trifolium pratense]
MDEYLQYMKTLRSHMNDAEDQAAKISAEEQMQMTNIRTLENDIDLAKSEIAQVVEDTDKMNKSKVEICSKILENQKKIASLESDTSRLTQTTELIRQEKVGLYAKLSERRAYYSKVAEDMSAKFQKQQVMDKVYGPRSESEGRTDADDNRVIDKLGSDAKKNLITNLDSAKARHDEILVLKSKVLMDINKIKLAIEDVKCRENEFKPELKAADITALEEEYNALLSDKAGETEYLQSMEKQVNKFKDICQVVKCACGEEYTVALNTDLQCTGT